MDRLAAAAQELMDAGETVTPERLDPIRDQLAFIDRSQLIDSELQYRRVVAGVQATVGGQYRLFLPDSAGSYLSDADEEISASQLGGYLQLDRRFLSDRLRVILAGRVDRHTNYSTQLSPKGGVVYRVAPGHNLRASYNTAFKSPTILENYLLINGILLGNRNGFTVRDAGGNVVREIDGLEPETVQSVELGYKGALGSRAFIDAVAYQSWHREFISPLSMVANPADPEMPTFGFDADGNQVADGTLFTYVNFGSARVQGADLGVNLYPTRGVTVAAGGSVIELADFANDQAGQGDLLLNVPAVKLKGSLTVENLGFDNWFVKLAGRWNSAYRFESGYWSASRFFDDGEIPARLVTNLSVGYDLPERGIGIRGFLVNALGDDRVDVLGAPQSGRMAYLQLVYRTGGLDY
jgi:iron complex outermembrane receptor protein